MDAGDRLDQERRLGGREAQRGAPDLNHVAGGTQRRQRQRRSRPRDEHDLNRGREMLQQERDLLVAAGLDDVLVVVKHENYRRRERVDASRDVYPLIADHLGAT